MGCIADALAERLSGVPDRRPALSAPDIPKYLALPPEWRFTMKTCPHCKRATGGNETFCIHCGAELPDSGTAPIPSETTISQTCSRCGQPIAPSQNFCSHCGARLQQETPVRKRSQIRAEKRSQVRAKEKTPLPSQTASFIQNKIRPVISAFIQNKFLPAVQALGQSKILSKDKNIAFISILAAILLFTGAHLFIRHTLDPVNQADKIAKYVENHKPAKLADAFTYTEKTYVNPKSFYTYMEDNQWILEKLKNAAKEAKRHGSAEVKDGSGNRIISIANKPFLLFYKKYEFRVRPVKALVSTPDPGLEAAISVGNKEPVPINKDRVNIGYFAPGPYEFTITYKDDYFTKEDKVEVYLSGEQYEFPINLKLKPIELTSDIPDAIVYINGKNTKKTAEEIQLAAAPLDGSVEIYAVATNENGEKIKSKTLHLTNGDAHITFPDAKQVKFTQAFYNAPASDAEAWILNFRKDYEKAVNHADFDYVADYFVRGTPIEKEYRDFVEGHRGISGYEYRFLSNDIVDAALLPDNGILIETREAFEYRSKEDGHWYYERQKRYTLQNTGDALKIADVEANTIKKERRD